jgi:hypothetical protein
MAITKITLKLIKQNGFKWQTRLLLREGASRRQDHNSVPFTKILSSAPEGD